MRKKVRQQLCANCSHSFEQGENYCPNCGQENHAPNQPIRHYTSELIESLLHLDSKILTTAKTMLMYPGKITREYNDNKRARYTPPVRLYVFVSLVFFVIVQIPTKYDRTNKPEEKELLNTTDTIPDVKNWIRTDIDSTSTDSSYKFKLMNVILDIPKDELPRYLEANEEDIDSLIILSNMKPNYFTRTMFTQIIRSMQADENFSERIKEKAIKFGSLSLFFLMPFFALLLYLAYYRRKKNYYEYLIFSVHYHTLTFLVLSIVLVINLFYEVNELIYFFIFLGLLYYLGKSLRVNYDGSRLKTSLKIAGIGFIYWIVSLLVALFALFLGWWFV